MKKIISILIIFVIYSYSFCQVSQQWVKSCGFSHYPNNFQNRLAIDKHDNIYLTCNINENGNENIHTVKYNTNGDTIWHAIYNDAANSNDYATGIIIDDSSNIYAIGISGAENSGQDYCTIKYNSSGVQQWIQIYNGYGNTIDIPEHVEIDHMGNVYITGYSSEYAFNYDYCTIKYNTNGVQQWIQRFNGPGNGEDVAVSLKLDHSNNVYVTGYCTGINNNYDIYTIKYNSNGVQQWLQKYSASANSIDIATDMAIDQNDNIYVTGFTYANNYITELCTIKYNSKGIQQWVRIYDGPARRYDEAYAIKTDSYGNVIITGRSSVDSSNLEMCTIKYNSSGTQQWVQNYEGTGNGSGCGNAIAIDRFNNIFVTGYTTGASTSLDYTTIKYNPSGTLQWVEKYNSGSNNDDISCSIVSDNRGNIFINGRCGEGSSNFENVTIKYHSLPLGSNIISSKTPEAFSLSQNYPNPFNPTTKIKFSIPNITPPLIQGGQGGLTTMKIYNILGREVATLINENLSPGTYEIEFDGSKYPCGVYFYQLTTGDFSQTKKLILLK